MRLLLIIKETQLLVLGVKVANESTPLETPILKSLNLTKDALGLRMERYKDIMDEYFQNVLLMSLFQQKLME